MLSLIAVVYVAHGRTLVADAIVPLLTMAPKLAPLTSMAPERPTIRPLLVSVPMAPRLRMPYRPLLLLLEPRDWIRPLLVSVAIVPAPMLRIADALVADDRAGVRQRAAIELALMTAVVLGCR